MPMSEAFKQERYKELSSIAKKQGGRIKTRSYSFMNTLVTAECRQGHSFRVTPKNLLRGSWCVKCRPLSRQQEFLSIAKDVAKEVGGKCLSKDYVNARTQLQWQCKSKHKWKATFDNVANKNSWCPTCSLESASERKTEWWAKTRKKKKRRG